jgi:hypothetical protein
MNSLAFDCSSSRGYPGSSSSSSSSSGSDTRSLRGVRNSAKVAPRLHRSVAFTSSQREVQRRGKDCKGGRVGLGLSKVRARSHTLSRLESTYGLDEELADKAGELGNGLVGKRMMGCGAHVVMIGLVGARA